MRSRPEGATCQWGRRDASMNKIGTPLPPKIVTLTELRKVLVPLTNGWRWADNAINDLWLKGAPIPTSTGQEECRILLPGQFKLWWGEVAQRMSYDMSGEEAYARATIGFSNNGGPIKSSR